MKRAQNSLQLKCPDHKITIGMLDLNPNAKRIGDCYECIVENDGDTKTLITIPAYLQDNSSFYENCRQRIQKIEEPPDEFLEALSKKEERLEKLSKHINAEKAKVAKKFEEMKKAVVQIIDQKERECLGLLETEILGLSESSQDCEKLLKIGWPKPSDVPNLYPEMDVLEERMSQLESMDQLQAFIAGMQENAQTQELYIKECHGDSLGVRRKVENLVQSFNVPESSFPKIQGEIFNSSGTFETLMKEFIQQKVKVENSIVPIIRTLTYKSKIIVDEQFELLRAWLPNGYKFDLKLLFRGSADGMSSVKFHEKCDGQGPTVTLIKCCFNGAASPSIIGGFLDQSWNSYKRFSSSKQAFLFSLAEESQNSVKCPICESYFQYAYFGCRGQGPTFGGGFDIKVYQDLKTGFVHPQSYSNAIALLNGHGAKFNVEEIEVFQVL